MLLSSYKKNMFCLDTLISNFDGKERQAMASVSASRGWLVFVARIKEAPENIKEPLVSNLRPFQTLLDGNAP